MRRSAIVLLVVGLALLLLPSSASARMYHPCAPAGPLDTAPNAFSTVTYRFGIGLGADCLAGTSDDAPDYLAQNVVTFTPPQWTVASDGNITDGAKVGHLSSLATIGLFDNECNYTLELGADLLEGTTDASKPIDAYETGKVALSPLTRDDDANGVPDGAQFWPTYLTALATREGWDLSKLRSRAIGLNATAITGVVVVVNLLTFEPGAPIGSGLKPDARLGYPTLAILGDPTAPPDRRDPVTDVCSPLLIDVSLSSITGGGTYRKNPSDGDYYFATYSRAAPDADGDGIENAADTCPFTVVPGWTVRSRAAYAADHDIDGIPNVCDPIPEPHISFPEHIPDEDGDGFENKADNCPIVANPDQADQDGDGIGDACDPHPTVVDGGGVAYCNVSKVTIGAGGYINNPPIYLDPCASPAGYGSCDVAQSGVLAILRELAGDNPHTICFPNVDYDCDGLLSINDVFVSLESQIGGYIIRPCDFYAPPG